MVCSPRAPIYLGKRTIRVAQPLWKVDHLQVICASCLMSTRLMTIVLGLKIAANEVHHAVFLARNCANPYPVSSLNLTPSTSKKLIFAFYPGRLLERAVFVNKLFKREDLTQCLSGPQKPPLGSLLIFHIMRFHT